MNSQLIATIGFGIIALILLGFAALILWKVYDNQISLVGLLSEPAGPDGPKASLSRFQFLIFTFVIAVSISCFRSRPAPLSIFRPMCSGCSALAEAAF